MLRRSLAARFERPLVVRHGQSTFRLSPEAARLRVDVEPMVRQALARSRRGNILTRAFRNATGGGIDASLPARIRYSEKAVSAFVARVARRVERRPRDARLVPLRNGVLRKVRSRNGIGVERAKLVRAIGRRLLEPGARRVVSVPTAPRAPELTTVDLARRYRTFVTIDREQKRLRLYRNLKLVKAYEIAVGKAGHTTPTGFYRIQTKTVNPAWQAPEEPWAGELAGKLIPPGSPDNPLEARWLGFYGGAGIHGTDDIASLGTAASHGCIRMSIPDVIELYERVPVRTPVYIA